MNLNISPAAEKILEDIPSWGSLVLALQKEFSGHRCLVMIDKATSPDAPRITVTVPNEGYDCLYKWQLGQLDRFPSILQDFEICKEVPDGPCTGYPPQLLKRFDEVMQGCKEAGFLDSAEADARTERIRKVLVKKTWKVHENGQD